MAEVPCGCITSLFTTLMPAKMEDGELWAKNGWYCGAQQSQYGGYSCPEFDIQEANKWAFHTTAHACDEPNEFGYYSECDMGGSCVSQVAYGEYAASYGAGDEYDINTNETYNVRLDYEDFEGHFVAYTTTFTQGDQ